MAAVLHLALQLHSFSFSHKARSLGTLWYYLPSALPTFLPTSWDRKGTISGSESEKADTNTHIGTKSVCRFAVEFIFKKECLAFCHRYFCLISSHLPDGIEAAIIVTTHRQHLNFTESKCVCIWLTTNEKHSTSLTDSLKNTACVEPSQSKWLCRSDKVECSMWNVDEDSSGKTTALWAMMMMITSAAVTSHLPT